MLTNALAKKPGRDRLRRPGQQGRGAAACSRPRTTNIPVIAFDSGVDSDVPVTTASTDNKAAAAEAAKHMSELIGGKGKVAMVVHDQTSRSGIDRRTASSSG